MSINNINNKSNTRFFMVASIIILATILAFVLFDNPIIYPKEINPSRDPGEIICLLNDNTYPLVNFQNKLTIYDNPYLKNKVLSFSFEGEIIDSILRRPMDSTEYDFFNNKDYLYLLTSNNSSNKLTLYEINYNNQTISNLFSIDSKIDVISGLVYDNINKSVVLIGSSYSHYGALCIDINGNSTQITRDKPSIIGVCSINDSTSNNSFVYEYTGSDVYVYSLNNSILVAYKHLNLNNNIISQKDFENKKYLLSKSNIDYLSLGSNDKIFIFNMEKWELVYEGNANYPGLSYKTIYLLKNGIYIFYRDFNDIDKYHYSMYDNNTYNSYSYSSTKSQNTLLHNFVVHKNNHIINIEGNFFDPLIAKLNITKNILISTAYRIYGSYSGLYIYTPDKVYMIDNDVLRKYYFSLNKH